MKNIIVTKIKSAGSFAFQAMHVSAEQRQAITDLMKSDEAVKVAQPFIRGDHPSLMIVEFWTDSIAVAETAIQRLADGMGVKLGNGKMTYEDAAAQAA